MIVAFVNSVFMTMARARVDGAGESLGQRRTFYRRGNALFVRRFLAALAVALAAPDAGDAAGCYFSAKSA